MTNLYSVYLNDLRREESEERYRTRSTESMKRRVLADPDKLDELAAAMTAQLSPVTRKAKKGKYVLASDAIDSVIPSDHPMKGFVYEYRDSLRKVLTDPRTAGADVGSLAHDTAMHMLTARPGGAPPRWVKSYEYKRREDAELIPLGKMDLRAPLFGGLPSYDEWLKYITNREEQYYGTTVKEGKRYKKHILEEVIPSPTELGIAAGAGGAIGTLIGGPVGTLTGAATATAGEFAAKPFRSLMEKTEWYRASASPLMISNRFIDRAKAFGISAIPEIAAGGTVDFSLFKALRVPAKMIGKTPTAGALTAARKETNANFKRLLKDKSFLEKMKLRVTHNRDRKLGWNPQDLLFVRMVKKWAGRGDKDAKSFVAELGRALSEAEVARMYMPPVKSKISNKEFTKAMWPGGHGVADIMRTPDRLAYAWGKLDDIAQEEAMTNPEGIVHGVFSALERMPRRKLATDLGMMENVDDLIGLRHRESMKGINRAAEEMAVGVSKSIPTASLAQQFRPKKYMRELVSKNPYLVRTAKFKPGKDMMQIAGQSLDSIEANKGIRNIVYEGGRPTAREAEMVIQEANTHKAVLEAKQIARPRGRPKTPEVPVEAGERKMAPKGQEKLAKELAEEHPPTFLDEAIDYDRAEALANEYGRMLENGEITAEEALALMDRLSNSVMKAAGEGTMTDEGAVSFLGSTDGFISYLRRVAANKALYAMLGVSAATISFFSGPTEAEAFPGVSFVKSLAKGIKNVGDIDEAAKAFLRKARESRYIVDPLLPDDQYLVRSNQYQRGLVDSSKGGPSNVLKHIGSLKKATRESSRWFFMTPFQVAEEVFNVGKYIMNNPGVWKASYQAAEYNNVAMGHRVFKNILREAGIKSEPYEIRRRFKPLVDRMVDQVEHDWRTGQVKKLDDEYDRFKKVKTQEDAREFDLELNRSTREEHTRRLGELKGATETFHQEFNEIARTAAAEIPSVRVTLALDDTPEFAKYPFLKGVDFHPDELTAIGRIREQLLEYKIRLDDMKVPTIKGPYAPHILHPEFTAKMFEDITGDTTAAAYLRFYRRSFNSRPLFPDIENTLLRYVSDTERRIQNQTFWDQGWDKVRQKTDFIPGAKLIFDTLEEGVKPMDQTVGNKVANLYAQFEVFKRLFLSPSAGLKHGVKMSANVVSAGGGQTAEVAPMAAVATAKRVLKADPTIRKLLASMGLTSQKEQNKLVASYFSSLIPARGARQRLLDIGLNTPEEYYTGIKNVWHKMQNVGGAWINLAELVDRGTSIFTAMDISAKRGLTIEQGLYGAYDLILRNNFLSREMNPKWLRNPKIRALLLFQGTPYKIMERRVVNAIRAGRSIKTMGKAVREATKTPEGRKKILRDLIDLKAYIKEGESELKSNLFGDALMQETDFFGTPMVNQFAKDVLMTGAATIGGGYAGANLLHHFFHVPFFSGMTYEPTIAFSPGIMAVMRGWKAYKEREEADDEFLFTKIMQRWLGPTGPFPDMMHKYKRLNEDDIPDRYDDSKYKYIFAIPAKGHH